MSVERTPAMIQNDILHGARSRVSIKERVSKMKKQYDLFLYRHGRVVADRTTDVRRVGGVVEAGLILADKRTAARVVTAINLFTDVYDGHAARKHEHGGTPEGAWRDQQYDKERSFLVEAALVARGKLDWRHMALRVGSDLAMNKIVRPYFAARGIDTKAGWAGKTSTTAVSLSEFTATSDENPQYIQKIATGAKLGRVGIYTAEWGIQYLKNKRAAKVEKA